jgi:hypothetical protein
MSPSSFPSTPAAPAELILKIVLNYTAFSGPCQDGRDNFFGDFPPQRGPLRPLQFLLGFPTSS